MLTRLDISNFTIIERLEITLAAGMTVITGETGAGKSIIVDALALVLGGRADSKMIRPQCSHAEISAVFDISDMEGVRTWLHKRDLDNDDNECFLRRVIGTDGRNRAYVNGHSMPIREIQLIGQQLATICGQHAHYALLDSRVQQRLLDQYGACQDLSAQVRNTAEEWAQLSKQLSLLRQGGSGEQQCELLRYQIRDIEALHLNVAELNSLEEEHQRQAAADELMGLCQQALQLNNHEDGSNERLRQAVRLMGGALAKDDKLQGAYEHLHSALQHSDEATRALEQYCDDFDIDPQRFQELDAKFNEIQRIAKLHNTEAALLPEVLSQLQKDLQSFEGNLGLLENGDQRLASLLEHYKEHAAELGEKRAQAASKMLTHINEILKALEMAHCRFDITLNPRDDQQPHPSGQESIKYMVSTNPDHPPGPLEKVASGGELSRISLALQVATLGVSTPSCLVFDEVDSGVSSIAAHQVGKLLASLGERGQALCVTHLAQVVGCARQHWVASKEMYDGRTVTKLRELHSTDERIEEMARIISGQHITDQARAHARELLQPC